MSSFRAKAIAGRVVLVHDMSDQVVISEFDPEEASTLLQQLEAALAQVVRGLAAQAAAPPPADALA
jgi:hypothetical protein